MNDEPQEQIRRLVEAQEKLKDQQYGMIVLTSGPTPISINDALATLLDHIRQILVKLEEEAGEAEEQLATRSELAEVCPSRTYLDYLSRLDFGHGEREDDPQLFDALATLRMVVG